MTPALPEAIMMSMRDRLGRAAFVVYYDKGRYHEGFDDLRNF